jgi:alkanesulfonate monooxygenase SsuD/methylene tetrahydromethanopterin reductase-like flavin-dependent oxidoreductase (luciferase family)
MTPFFSPGPNPHGNPPIHLAGVGPRMTAVAGEVADGFMAHAFSTERYLHEVTLPALREGFERAGRDGSGFEFSGTALIATGDTEEEFAESIRDVRRTIAIVAEPDEVGPALERRFGGVAQRIPLYAPSGSQTDRWGPALAHLQGMP